MIGAAIAVLLAVGCGVTSTRRKNFINIDQSRSVLDAKPFVVTEEYTCDGSEQAAKISRRLDTLTGEVMRFCPFEYSRYAKQLQAAKPETSCNSEVIRIEISCGH
jgi:hypothetical protein